MLGFKTPRMEVRGFSGFSGLVSFVIVGIVVIRDFIILKVVQGDETCFTPTFPALFSP